MAPITQRYISPEERVENRARWIRFAYLIAVVIPLTGMVMMYGYSDQAPAWLRDFAVNLDAAFGFPILSLIKAIAA